MAGGHKKQRRGPVCKFGSFATNRGKTSEFANGAFWTRAHIVTPLYVSYPQASIVSARKVRIMSVLRAI